jgi:hypothetical protein
MDDLIVHISFTILGFIIFYNYPSIKQNNWLECKIKGLQ